MNRFQPGLNKDDFLDLESKEAFIVSDLPDITPASPTSVFGNSRLAKENDLDPYLNPSDSENGVFLDHVTVLVESGEKEKRHLKCLPKVDLFLPAHILCRNIQISGMVGSGKTAGLMFPLTLKMSETNSVDIITDLKGDVYTKLKAISKKQKPCMVLNPSNPARCTHAFNFLGFDNKTSDLEIQNRLRTFFLSSQTRENRDSEFWDESGLQFAVALVSFHLKKYNSVNPGDICASLQLPRPDLLKILRTPGLPFGPQAACYLEVNSSNAETVLATVSGKFKAFMGSGGINATTSRDELNISRIFEKPQTLIIEIDQGCIEITRTVVNILVSMIMQEATNLAGTSPDCMLPLPLNLILDDVTGIGKLPEFATFLNTARSRNIRVIAACQSARSQFCALYGTDEGKAVMDGFSTKIFVPPCSWDDALMASELTGKMTASVIDSFQEKRKNDSSWVETSRTIRSIQRPVLDPDDILNNSPRHWRYETRAATVILPGVPTFQAWFRPFYDYPAINSKVDLARKSPRLGSLREVPLVWISKTDTTGPQYEIRLGKIHCQFKKASPEAIAFWTALEKTASSGAIIETLSSIMRYNLTLIQFMRIVKKGKPSSLYEANLIFLLRMAKQSVRFD